MTYQEVFNPKELISEAVQTYNNIFKELCEPSGLFRPDLIYPDIIALDGSIEQLRDYLGIIKLLKSKLNIDYETLIDNISIMINQINQVKINMIVSDSLQIYFQIKNLITMAEKIIIAQLDIDTKAMQEKNARYLYDIQKIKEEQKKLSDSTNGLKNATLEQLKVYADNDAALKNLQSQYNNNKKILAENMTGVAGLSDALGKEVTSINEAKKE